MSETKTCECCSRRPATATWNVNGSPHQVCIECLPERNLDALVAEKLMGLNVEWIDGNPYWVGPAGTLPGSPYFPLAGNREGISVKHYSTDIRAAWEVLERMTELLGNLSVEYAVAGSDKNGWTVCELEGHDINDISQGKTAPLAICRAALKAIEH